ncbi:EAL domain-containing protein [Serratia quinivorans]|uniref:bifunctional diguanylate cyclase/phosphodiesterase n=1 Tax=Serratia quinivorans TaxID=137545 RepID=UPI002178285A|nr:EAL domain-containing protein [Serratia quinivorans]CAI0815658.1 Cyclic di-GMP phosphodiesterase Gmr [Serratia quinivorans]CAI0818214.1 Cyclic di-GMP phosphodiesterase Gmr [Serratia quinivorans]CAI0841519.1 Cyclic di-GMP phosphodiesterase Gmr [Serratia quinivorans]CAI1497276.1 Cyclic di-GMP phosphodiesterase Gmr [Serratia quinivorans]CAI2035283.1 Cyclic di-GMP phosphodiesterase Gmr [Serratia quinivorans]
MSVLPERSDDNHPVDMANEIFNGLPNLIGAGNSLGGHFNTLWCEYTGLASFDHQDACWLKALHPDDYAHIESLWQQSITAITSFVYQARLRHYSGEYRWFLLSFGVKKAPNSAQNHWFLSCTDIHQQMLEKQIIAEKLAAQKNMLDASVDCIKVINNDGSLLHMNKAGSIALGIDENRQQFGMPWLSLLQPEGRQRGQKALRKVLSGRNARFAGLSATPDGRLRHWDNILTPVIDKDSRIQNILCVSRDVTSQRIAEKRLLIASEYDELTGLPNRRLFKKRLKQEMKRSLANNKSLGLILLDLDHFKLVNDTLGHDAGDHLLRVLALRLKADLNPNSFVSRLGGDEFAVVISDVENEQDIFKIANDFLLQLETPITHGGKALHCGMSIGGALYPQDARDASELMKCADTALYELKDGGRGGVYMFNPQMMDKARERATQLNHARQIVRNNQIRPSYQPKINLTTGAIVGFEALLRWYCPQNGIQMPESVCEAFSDYELATKIGETMQMKVFADISAWLASGAEVLPVSLNASPIEFLRDSYAETFLQRLQMFNIPHHLIELEVTEHAFNKHGSKYVLRALQMLKEMGIRIALDDFGTGHSSLTHLMNYPLDCIKLDRDFIRRMNNETPILGIVESMGILGQKLSIDIIAEGIETEQQRQTLCNSGYHLGQGFLFSQAVEAPRALSMLLNSPSAKITA